MSADSADSAVISRQLGITLNICDMMDRRRRGVDRVVASGERQKIGG